MSGGPFDVTMSEREYADALAAAYYAGRMDGAREVLNRTRASLDSVAQQSTLEASRASRSYAYGETKKAYLRGQQGQ